MPEAAGFDGVSDRSALQDFSVSNSESFWAAAARHRLSWMRPFHTVQDCDLSRGRIKWFEGGQLNVSVNCLDRHVHTCPERVALIWERDESGSEVKVTYRELLEMTCRLGNLLRRHGVKRGDTVTIYMPTCPLAVASMLACARIGAAHNVVFAGFSAEALAERIRDAQSSTVITVNQGVRGGKVSELKETVDTAVRSCPAVQQVFVAMRTENPVAMTARDVAMEEEMLKEESVCEPAAMDSEDVLFLLYTSGSTGKPKGLVHTQAGYLLYAALTHRYVFSYHDGDVFGCVADIGWITGHSYSVYGPLANGGTTVLFESTPVYPDPGRYWEMVQRLKINQFYGAPTAIRLLLKYGDEWVHKYDRSTLKTLGSVGEPINTEAWEWYHRVVGGGRCPVVDTWWQTVAESAVIGYSHDLKGQGVYAFVVLKKAVAVQRADLCQQLSNMVSKKIAKYACPDFIQFVQRLPKTRSGKIMRRVLRKVVERDLDGLGDLSTLEDPVAVQEIIQDPAKPFGSSSPELLSNTSAQHHESVEDPQEGRLAGARVSHHQQIGSLADFQTQILHQQLVRLPNPDRNPHTKISVIEKVDGTHVSMKRQKGMAVPVIACVDGMLYSEL
ncbi:Acetyl-coenzyme A synthetase 2-like, mitochondrial [Liparis tanakae]|uniref:acetate--CoA ligase n=1 Tax=Liparis tanakae TaxID=230148 RepID=A0A4Z2IZM3_9TELE|nr:Acetyl-coenzyme A synthetase 2-like, mitochondrial [Liparis tanakae]